MKNSIRLATIAAILVLFFTVVSFPINLPEAQSSTIRIQPELTLKIIHNIQFDKTTYLTTETAIITVTDSTLNSNSRNVDAITIKLFSKSNPREKSFTALETDVASGIFLTKVKISDITNVADTITAYYNYEIEGKTQKVTITATTSVPKLEIKSIEPIEPKLTIRIIPPTITLDKESYLTTDTMKITISNLQANTNPKDTDSVKFVIYSESNPRGQTYSAVESDPNSGLFFAAIKVGAITDKSEKLRIILSENPEVEISTSTTQSQLKILVPTDEKLEESFQTIEPIKIKTALDSLLTRKIEQTTEKTLEQIQSSIIQKESLLQNQQNLLNFRLTQGDNPLLLIKEREDLLHSKINYLSEKAEYIQKTKTTTKQVSEFETELKELVTERKELSYDGLSQPFEKKVSTTRIDTLDEVVKPTKLIPTRLDTKIQRLSTSLNPTEYAQKAGLEIKDERVKILVDFSSIPENVRESIQLLGGQIESESEKQVQLNIPIIKLQELSNLATLKQIRPSNPILQHSLISQGVDFINADIVQQGGFTGKGVDVAVLDLAFNTENVEISSNIAETKSFRSSFGEEYPIMGYSGEHIHGTAVAEIIVDVAPDVDLHLYAMGTELEFSEAIDWAIEQDMDIITMSAGWINYPTDGTSPMTQKLEQAVSNGITVVISAGNYAETHFEGIFKDNDSNGWHEFSGSDEGLSIEVLESRFTPIVLHLLWDTHDDFDLVLIGPGDEIVDSSENPQQNANDLSLETINFMPDDAGFYEIGISFTGVGKPSANLELFSPTDILEYSVASGSVGVPTDAQGIITVGAIHHADASLEAFSSQGPTNNGKQVPSVMGPDAVSTLEFDEFPFYGTSAAAPYVAGVAALVLEQNPGSSPSQVLAQIQNHADKNAVLLKTNYDNIFGHGKLDAEFIILDAGDQIGEDTSDISSLEDEGKSPTTLGADDYGLGSLPTKLDVQIPSWIKEQVKWWIAGSISDSEFINAIEFLIKNDIIVIPNLPESESGSDQSIPHWIINNAKWWVDGQISDTDFAKGLEFLIKVGIIRIG